MLVEFHSVKDKVNVSSTTLREPFTVFRPGKLLRPSSISGPDFMSASTPIPLPLLKARTFGGTSPHLDSTSLLPTSSSR